MNSKGKPEGAESIALDDAIRRAHEQALADEEIGVHHRIENFYLPLFRDELLRKNAAPEEFRILDCGCGNGASLEYLHAAGFQAYGIDLASFRTEQWRARSQLPGVHLLAADATHLPFSDASFDIVLSCGMLEHIGVAERCTPDYIVEALPEQAHMRRRFLAESMRVLKPRGVLYVDHPNGRFPIDFWHNDYRARPRLHWPNEPFLPSFSEVVQRAKEVAPGCRITAISPADRFTFRRSERRWYGRVLGKAMRTWLSMLRYKPLTWTASSALNPYLVIRIDMPPGEPHQLSSH